MHRCFGVDSCLFTRAQDTNALCFTTAVACIGFSNRENLEVNSVCVPRMAGEAVGAIARLEREDGSSITCNVEYNQLAPLLKYVCDPLMLSLFVMMASLHSCVCAGPLSALVM